MRHQRLHDIGFFVVAALCAGFLLAVTRGAQERERRKLVAAWEPEEAAYAADREVLEAALAGIAGGGDGLPDVVLIAVDGLRADAVGALEPGGMRATPAIDELARGAALVGRLQAPSSEPALSRASLLTGRHPIEHGVLRDSRGGLARRLSEGLPTLAERLGGAGYRTVGISGAGVGGGAWHLSRGFDAFVGKGLPAGAFALDYARADRVTELALAAAEGLAGGGRFLWVEYRDPAVPWVAWEDAIADPLSLVHYALWWPGKKKSGWTKRRRLVLSRSAAVQDSTRETWRAAYAADVRLMDRELGRLLEGLAQRGIGEEDWVILVGAHGMYLGEHELLGEGLDVYQEGVDVPLIVRAPAALSPPVDATGLADALLEALGLEPLVPPDERDALAVSEVYYAPALDLRASYGSRFRRVRRAFRDGEHLLLLDDRGQLEAFDLGADPGQRRPLSDAGWIEPLHQRAERWLSDHRAEASEARP